MLRILAILFLATFAGTANAEEASLVGLWKNQGGSLMEIEHVDAATGAIKGTYTNEEDNYFCVGVPMDLSGWIIEDIVTFSVRWKHGDDKKDDCKSITNWTGNWDGNTIRTTWNLWGNTDLGLAAAKGADDFARDLTE